MNEMGQFLLITLPITVIIDLPIFPEQWLRSESRSGAVSLLNPLPRAVSSHGVTHWIIYSHSSRYSNVESLSRFNSVSLQSQGLFTYEFLLNFQRVYFKKRYVPGAPRRKLYQIYSGIF